MCWGATLAFQANVFSMPKPSLGRLWLGIPGLNLQSSQLKTASPGQQWQPDLLQPTEKFNPNLVKPWGFLQAIAVLGWLSLVVFSPPWEFLVGCDK